MEQKELTTILIGLGLAVVLGLLAARSSNNRDKIYGGPLAHFFHYIGAGLLVAVAPMVLASAIFIHLEFGSILLIAVGFFAASYVSLLIYASLERPALARVQTEDRGWTEADARTSGL